ncbi:hypothetical protein K4749_26385 [Streptomyces sp. TRM72054]|uniref:hypothetical protein n=1 Tax=Streptomyces sp. TRM72054 TaxID=2870562 RepID=UPI001C8BEE71|nr:hypothetical protein [Streptomyces sp. TRM72054]MBX9397025.1 hypothetical protein [Streptomyces sp. TRM72054]
MPLRPRQPTGHRLHDIPDRPNNPLTHGPPDTLNDGLPNGRFGRPMRAERAAPGATETALAARALTRHHSHRRSHPRQSPRARRRFSRVRPLPAQHPQHEQPTHQQDQVQRTPPRRHAQHTRGGAGQCG